MYDLVVHYGAPKTGSSAIQYFLLQNRVAMEECGFYYPPHPHDRNAVSGGHSRLGHALLNKDNVQNDEASVLLEEYLTEARAKNLTLLLSAESLYVQADEFYKLTENLTVRVLGFYRDPLDLILSSYNQLVKRSFMTDTLTGYCRSLLAKQSIKMDGKMHERWADLFGDDHVSVLPYDAALFKNESIERRFLASLGIPAVDYSKFKFLDKPINGSYSRSALSLKRLLNFVLDQKQSKFNGEIDRCLQHYSDRHAERRIGLAELIPPDVYEGLVDKLRGSNDSIRARFFPDAGVSFLTDHDQVNHAIAPFTIAGDFSPAYVANIAFSDYDELVLYIKQCIADHCMAKEQRGLEQYVLADLAGLNINATRNPSSNASFLNAKQIERLTGVKIAVPQMLRELAVAHEGIGDNNAARQFIERACELRPDSVPFQTIRDRILKALG